MSSKIFIPGVSQKDLILIQEKLGTNKLTELGKAAKARKIRQIEGISGKVEMAIIRGIKLLEEKPKFLPIGTAYTFAQILIGKINAWPNVSQVLLVGALRRGKEQVGQIELLLECKRETIIEKLEELPAIEGVLINTKEYITLNTILGAPVILHFSNKNNWGKNSLITTGSTAHIKGLAEFGDFPELISEREIYSGFNLPFISPEIRETGYEIGIAKDGLLPDLIEEEDIRGDLHIHSKWSDGINTIEEIIQENIKRGYEYMAITDHSQSLTVAGGMTQEELVKQSNEITALQLKYPQIKILKGIEVDILQDGTLDFTDDILKTLDIVIASIHSHFKMSEEDMTKRIIKAIKNPLVHVIAHPTGRILGKRPGYNVNIEEIMSTARSYNKVLEVNASPDRLDLRDVHLQYAKTKGVKIVINTDSHSIKDLENMSYGIQTAKRGWQTRDDVINSWSYEKLMNFLKEENIDAKN